MNHHSETEENATLSNDHAQRFADEVLKRVHAETPVPDPSRSFETKVMKRLRVAESETSPSRAARWLMRLYWTATALATVLILYRVVAPRDWIAAHPKAILVVAAFLLISPLLPERFLSAPLGLVEHLFGSRKSRTTNPQP